MRIGYLKTFATAATLLMTMNVNTIQAQFLLPRVSYSQPMGEQSDSWLPGYGIGLDYYRHLDSNSAWGVRFAFNHWVPNAEDLLSVNGRTLEIEKASGWKTISELSGMYARELVKVPALGSLWGEGSIGIYHLRWPEIELLGNYAVEGAALNRAIIIPESAELVPGASLAITMTILNRVEPMVRYQKIFAEDDTSILWFGLGLLSN